MNKPRLRPLGPLVNQDRMLTYFYAIDGKTLLSVSRKSYLLALRSTPFVEIFVVLRQQQIVLALRRLYPDLCWVNLQF